MLHLIEATRFHLNGELTERNLWLKQKFERVLVFFLLGCYNVKNPIWTDKVSEIIGMQLHFVQYYSGMFVLNCSKIITACFLCYGITV